ncbi:MAG: glycosyltransferase, partial [Nitrospinota bacterium]
RNRVAYYWDGIVNYCNYFIHDDDRVLEIGCGNGESLSKLKGRKRTGIDFSPKMIALAKKKYSDIEFIQMDAESITFDTTFDVIILSNVIGYFENIQQVFESMKSVCHKGTRVIITYYNYMWEPVIKLAEFIGVKKRSLEQNWLSQIDIDNLLYLSGFEGYKSTRRLLVPVNIPVLSFLMNKFFSKLPLFNFLCLNTFVCARPICAKKESTEKQYSTTVVIPARNESGNIENAVTRLPQFGKHVEIIFVEGNSQDDTWETIQKVAKKYKATHDIKFVKQDGKGKGDAVRKGYSIASGDILMILDADLTVPPEELPKFYNALAEGKGEFINGSRMVYPMEKKAMRPLNVLGNKFFSVSFSWILETSIKDTLCGTKVMFKKDYVKLAANKKFFGDFDPFGDFDLIFGAYKLNLKIIDLPIRYKERTYGDTNISRFRHGLILLRMCAFAAYKIKFW